MKYGYIVLCILMSASRLFSMDVDATKPTSEAEQFDCAQATPDDVLDIVKLYEEIGMHEQDKIVILPKAFRARAVSAAIDKKRYYVARNKAGELVALKKLFVLEDPQEKHAVLVDELRCNQLPSKVAMRRGDQFEDQPIPSSFMLDESGVYVYTGGDLTHPKYRGKGINTALTNKALDDIADAVAELLTDGGSISLAYGITQHNAGEGGARGAKDRTVSIVKSFDPFADRVTHAGPTVYRRFRAHKPSFDPDATECRPLPDDQSVPGYGCLLTREYPKDSDE